MFGLCLWLKQLDGDCLPSLCHLPEHGAYANRQGDPDFSLGPIRDPFPSDRSKPFLSLFLFVGRFPFVGELVISHHIYCQPGTGPPPTSFQLLGSQEPSPGFLCLRNKCGPTGAGDLPMLAHPSPSHPPAWHPEGSRCTTKIWGGVCKSGWEKGDMASVLDLGSRQRDETLPSVPLNSFL